jgi:hypothetical protein
VLGTLAIEVKTPLFRGFAIASIILIASSRVYVGAHFISDTLGGALLAIAVYRCIPTPSCPPDEPNYSQLIPTVLAGTLLVTTPLLLSIERTDRYFHFPQEPSFRLAPLLAPAIALMLTTALTAYSRRSPSTLGVSPGDKIMLAVGIVAGHELMTTLVRYFLAPPFPSAIILFQTISIPAFTLIITPHLYRMAHLHLKANR